MAFLIPSYFQKRLLRYALSRLDFLETEDLDLENLGITFGQRSIIELKDIGIRVGKLEETIPLPEVILLKSARIKLLRLTIPADLNRSGIEIEILGVDVQIHLKDVEPKQPSRSHRQTPTPSRQEKVDRQRIASPPIHDPGGASMPTSENLAVSFLQSEPVEEKRELQAAIESQSFYLQESGMLDRSAGGGTGLGAPGGVSLPTFVADFFQGVADRLSVRIQDVRLTAELRVHKQETAMGDSVRAVLKLGSLEISGLNLKGQDTERPESKRKIEVRDLEILLMSDSGLLQPVSTVSSPRLNRGQTQKGSAISDSSSALAIEQLNQIEQTLGMPTILSQISSGPPMGLSSSSKGSSGDVADFASVSDLDSTTSELLADAATARSQSPLSSSAADLYSVAVEEQDVFHEIDNRAHAEEMVRTQSLARSSTNQSTSGRTDAEDLSQSRYFTHDEAKSMYMSAIGGDEPENQSAVGAIPGAWNHSESFVTDPRSFPQAAEQATLPIQQVVADTSEGPEQLESSPSTLDSDLPKEPIAESTSSNKQLSKSADFVTKRVAFLDRVTLRLPTSRTESEASHSALFENFGGAEIGTNSAISPVGASNLFESSISTTDHPPIRSRRSTSQDLPSSELADLIEIDAGILYGAVDLPIGRLLIKICQDLSQSSEKPKVDHTTEETLSVPSVRMGIGEIRLQFCEAVAEINASSVTPQLPTGGASGFQDALVQLSLERISLRPKRRSGRVLQEISIRKALLGHNSKPVLSFGDQDAGSMAERNHPHQDDVSIIVDARKDSKRVEVQTLPIHITLDLLQIDEVLSRSGGLSSMLDLGNSMFSANTIRDNHQLSTADPPKRRSVRFEAASQDMPEVKGGSSPLGKIDVRVAGCTIDLVGSETTMQVQTSALKAVYREQIAGVQIDWLEVNGPSRPGTSQSGHLAFGLNNVAVRYLSSPEDKDLDRLLSILTPSKDKYNQDDDIMIDTLLRQRRKGSVLRAEVSDLNIVAEGSDWHSDLSRLLDEMSRLSSVAKYLPDDDRPGILTLLLVKRTVTTLDLNRKLGTMKLQADALEVAHVNIPSLVAAQAMTISVTRNEVETFLTTLPNFPASESPPPMLMCRFIADEMEPMIKLKLTNTALEYRVSTAIELMDFLKDNESAKDRDSPSPSPSTAGSDSSSSLTRKIGFSLTATDCIIGLSPHTVPAKGLFVLTDASFLNKPDRRKDTTALVNIRKASILIIDNEERIQPDGTRIDQQMYFDESDLIQYLAKAGFVPVANLASAAVRLKISYEPTSNEQYLDIEFRNNLFILETCADSTQTLIQIINNLSPPSPPSKELKYRTEVMPITDMLASFTGDAFITEPGPEAGQRLPTNLQFSDLIEVGEDVATERTDESQSSKDEYENEGMAESYVDSELAQSALSAQPSIAPVGITESVSASTHESIMAHSLLDFRSDHFSGKSSVGGTAHRWNSNQNTYGLGNEADVSKSPLRVRIRDVHIIWNLFDGYDWQSTRDAISHAVKNLETKAASKRPRSNSRLSPGLEDDEESVIGDFLFNSIYIGIPRGKEDLTSAINHDIDELASETGSNATNTTVTPSPTRRQATVRSRKPALRLNRSRQHKMTFELKGISADFLMFPPNSGEIESSTDIRIKDLEIFDHVPTSTWKKFATYMQDAGEREVDTNMIHLEILNVKPVPDLAASEMILKATVLPLRLHVDQDALDFMTRFFEFKDDSAPPSVPSVPPFLQRVEVNPVQLKLDFKPKRVDYGGLRSGRTTEFMNFIVLDRADILLRRIILYGVSGFDRLGIMLNNIWMPDVKRNQLPGVLKGLAPIRPLIDVGGGIRQIVAVPMAEYRKDGRIVRSIQKGAVAFASTTAKELINLGAKLAIGTQTVLQSAEATLSPGEEDVSDEERKQISLYADQPIGIVQGLRGAWASLERDLLLARDAIVAVPGEVMASGSATGAAKVVLKSSPAIILRPAIGASKAVGQTLLGAGNAMDRENLRRIDEVSYVSLGSTTDLLKLARNTNEVDDFTNKF